MHGYKSQNDTLLLEKKKDNTNKRRNMKWEQFGLVRNENGQPIKYEFLIEISYQFPNIKKKKKETVNSTKSLLTGSISNNRGKCSQMELFILIIINSLVAN